MQTTHCSSGMWCVWAAWWPHTHTHTHTVNIYKQELMVKWKHYPAYCSGHVHKFRRYWSENDCVSVSDHWAGMVQWFRGLQTNSDKNTVKEKEQKELIRAVKVLNGSTSGTSKRRSTINMFWQPSLLLALSKVLVLEPVNLFQVLGRITRWEHAITNGYRKVSDKRLWHDTYTAVRCHWQWRSAAMTLGHMKINKAQTPQFQDVKLLRSVSHWLNHKVLREEGNLDGNTGSRPLDQIQLRLFPAAPVDGATPAAEKSKLISGRCNKFKLVKVNTSSISSL